MMMETTTSFFFVCVEKGSANLRYL